MRLVSDFCKSYFNGFHEAYNCQNQDTVANLVTVVKIASYPTLVIPLAVIGLYGADLIISSLCGRIQHYYEDKITKKISDATKYVFYPDHLKIKFTKEIISLIKELQTSQDLIDPTQITKILPVINTYLLQNNKEIKAKEAWKNIWTILETGTTYTFTFGEKERKISQNLVNFQSLVFPSMKEDKSTGNEVVTIPLANSRPEIIELFLDCMERGFIGEAITDKNMIELMLIADHYHVDWMLDVCKTFINSNLNQNNVVEVYKNYQGKVFADDPLTKACLEKIIKRYQNSINQDELINQFDPANHAHLRLLLKNTPNGYFKATLEILFLFLPNMTGSKYPKLNESLIVTEMPKYFKGHYRLGLHEKFLKAFKIICPFAHSMTTDEKFDLFRSFNFQLDTDLLADPPRPYIDSILNMLYSIAKSSSSFLNNKEFRNNFQKLFSRLIYRFDPYGIHTILKDIYDKSVEADELEELLFVIGETSRLYDSFFYGQHAGNYGRMNSDEARIWLTEIRNKMPKGERKELMTIAGYWFEEEKNKPWSINSPFFCYRKILIELLVGIPREDRKVAEIELRKLQRNGCLKEWYGYFQIEIVKWLPGVLPEDKLNVLKEINALLGKFEGISLYQIQSIIFSYTEHYKYNYTWIIEPCLKFIKPQNAKDLEAILNLLPVVLKDLSKLKLDQFLARYGDDPTFIRILFFLQSQFYRKNSLIFKALHF